MSITMYLPHTVDLAQPLRKTVLPSAFLTGDDQAHCFRLTLLESGKPLSVSGASVTGYFIRPDNSTVVIVGKASGSTAELTLPDSCYHVPGRFSLVIRLTLSGVKTTVFWAEGSVSASSTDTLVDDGAIPTLDDLMAQIHALEQATADAEQVTQQILAMLEGGQLTGKGLQILGYYASLSELQSAVKTPAAGDAYAVGTAAPYDIFIWDAVSSAWVNNGALQGVQGEQGPKGDTGERGPAGISAGSNLLDNSDFRSAVNQRGKTSYTGAAQYTIDRWRTWNSSYTVQINTGWIIVTGAIQQYVEAADPDTIYTLAACDTAGNIRLLSGKPSASPDNTTLFMGVGSNGYTHVGIRDGMWLWAALYKGSYTADTLPEFLPRGRAAELAECQRYYRQYSTFQLPLTVTTAAWCAAAIDYTSMRITPTVTYDLAGLYAGNTMYTNVTEITARVKPASELVINVGEAVAANQTGTIRFNSLALSADL